MRVVSGVVVLYCIVLLCCLIVYHVVLCLTNCVHVKLSISVYVRCVCIYIYMYTINHAHVAVHVYTVYESVFACVLVLTSCPEVRAVSTVL